MDEKRYAELGIDAPPITKEPTPAQRWRNALVAFGILALLLFVFQWVTGEAWYSRAQEELKQNEAVWASKGVSSYQFMLIGYVWVGGKQHSSTAEVVVENGAVASKQIERNSFTQADIQMDDVDTVPELFAKARQALGIKHRSPFKLFTGVIGYDRKFGYPTEVTLTGSYQYRAYSLTPLAAYQPVR
ncbi:MAG: hypothetical protein HYX80_01005 [Chloroflexi bacterium]|nr:hypothetical protein [Chloroflexota bacterium]